MKFFLYLFCVTSLFLSSSFSKGKSTSNKEVIATDSTSKQPNFIFILVDDLGTEQIASYGSKENSTPNIDQLADEGMRFRTAYATPICTPTRVELMTGRYGFRTGWLNFTGRKGSPTATDATYVLGKEETTFAQVLQKNGYKTGLAGRWLSVGDEHYRIPIAGFDEYQVWGIWGQKLPPGVKHTGEWEKDGVVTSRYWYPCIIRDGEYIPTEPEDYSPNLMLEYSKDFLRRNRDKPFFLFYPMNLVHNPFRSVPNLENPGEQKEGNLKEYVEYTDYIVGDLMDELDDLGLTDNTIVIFAGDNGTINRGKGTATEKGARVPFIVRNPEQIQAGVVSDELTDFSDLFPTFADFASLPMPENITFDGKSLVPTLRGGEGEHRPWIYSYFIDDQIMRDRRWLYENGRFYDCGNNRDGDYKDVTSSIDPEVVEARKRFAILLKKFEAKPSQLQEKQQ